MKTALTKFRSTPEWKEELLAYCKKKGWSLTHLLTSSADKEMERNP